MNQPSLRLHVYDDRFKQDFERLNREWLEKYFAIEDIDRKIFADPKKYIIEPGGQIFLIEMNGEIVGTSALIRISADRFELAKMAVTESAQGQGLGGHLIQVAIEEAKKRQARAVELLTNSSLHPAIHLYSKFGFEHVAMSEEQKQKYARGDVYMVLSL